MRTINLKKLFLGILISVLILIPHSSYAFDKIPKKNGSKELEERFLYTSRDNDTIKIKAKQAHEYIGKLVKVDFLIDDRIDTMNKYILSYVPISDINNKVFMKVILVGAAYKELKKYPTGYISVIGRLSKKGDVIFLKVKKKENMEIGYTVE